MCVNDIGGIPVNTISYKEYSNMVKSYSSLVIINGNGLLMISVAFSL
jgi:hypothetical protein